MACDKVIEQLSAFLDGELAAAETEAVRSHLDSCAGCRREMEDLRQTAGALSELPRMPAPPGLRAKVLAGLPAGLRPVSEEENAEPEVREVRSPRWRMFWGAAAAVLLAAVVMVLGIPAKRNPSAGRSPEVASAVEHRREAPAPVPAPAAGQPSEAVDRTDKDGAAVMWDGSAKDAAGSAAQTDEDKKQALAEKLDAARVAGTAHADAATAASSAPAIEEIALPSADPQAAFARARALAEERGWLAPERLKAASAGPVKAESQVPKIALRLKRSEVPLLKDALAKAGLGAETEARFAAKPPPATVAGRGASAGGYAARKEKGFAEPGLQGQKAMAAAPAAPTPAAPLAAPARAEERRTMSPSMPSADAEQKPLAKDTDALTRERSPADDAFVQVVLAFPRAEGAAPAASVNGNAK